MPSDYLYCYSSLSLATSQTSHAHSGGLDANGCMQVASLIIATGRQVKWLVIDCGVTLVVALKIALLVQKLLKQIPQYAKLRRVLRQQFYFPTNKIL